MLLDTLTKNDLIAFDRIHSQRSFAAYAKKAWPILEPETELQWGWALDAICLHLEAVSRGYITRLAMMVPPGMMKSLLTSVLWPTWEWGPMGLSHKRTLRTSHTASLAERDSIKARNIINSQWYQERWPMKLVKDTDAWIENGASGFQRAMAFTKMTGARGDNVVLDDPIAAEDANSEAELMRAERAFRETLPTRVNNAKSAIVLIMQRLNAKDTVGVIEDNKLPYTKLILPMEFDPERRCSTYVTVKGQKRLLFRDPRTKPGELLFPERFSRKSVDELKAALGSYATAGQLQQLPSPRKGGIFQRHYFQTVKAAPYNCVWVRGWDLAGTDKEQSPWTVGCLMGKTGDGRLYIKNVSRIQGNPGEVKRMVVNTTKNDGYGVYSDIPQDPGQAGKAQAQDFVAALQGYNVTYSPESGDKFTRALPLSAQAEAGNLFLVEGDWNNDFLDEITAFPNSKFKDQVDAASRAYHKLLNVQAYDLERAM